jgi:hypothetical protein
MTSFPHESLEYRQARNRLLEQEIALRQITEARPSGAAASPLEPLRFHAHGARNGPVSRPNLRLIA